ncbi:hypothetical protein BpJC4_20180 [Weizmannia acidilactici]|uniref:hypothetical protein n=1 Tax=Weizmannia acidilactici TaxID=2607726 RepID=UPI001273E05C|nr:hypothetical protein [Weizmannia acidilactici]GER67547.1 hypothetical protein BpJC4_20180 [Weizmannia acidilactici]
MLAVVAAASNTPISAVMLGYELYGHITGLYVMAACIAGYMIIGHQSVYHEQLVFDQKSLWVQLEPDVELKKWPSNFPGPHQKTRRTSSIYICNRFARETSR